MKVTDANVAKDLSRVNLADISNVQLTKWIRDNIESTLADAFVLNAFVREAYRLGEIRGKALQK